LWHLYPGNDSGRGRGTGLLMIQKAMFWTETKAYSEVCRNGGAIEVETPFDSIIPDLFWVMRLAIKEEVIALPPVGTFIEMFR
jgi:hypothetical protein